MNFIINLEQYIDSEYLKKTFYQDRKKCKSDELEYEYSISRYDKSLVDMKDYTNVKTLGHIRSVVSTNDGKVVCYSPPKSIQWDDFMIDVENNKFTPIIEEYVEGTMINMFWDTITSSWEYSTKNTIGCKNHFKYIDFDINNQRTKQFITMFNEAYYYNFLHHICFDKSLCYSFVLQHMILRQLKI